MTKDFRLMSLLKKVSSAKIQNPCPLTTWLSKNAAAKLFWHDIAHHGWRQNDNQTSLRSGYIYLAHATTAWRTRGRESVLAQTISEYRAHLRAFPQTKRASRVHLGRLATVDLSP
jgi:hypothetical protein